MVRRIFNYNTPYNNKINSKLKNISNLADEKRDLFKKNNANLTEIEKKNIKNTERKIKSMENNIETLEREKLLNFNKNLDIYKDLDIENKLYDLLNQGYEIHFIDMLKYQENPEIPIRNEAILLDYIVRDLRIRDYAQLNKLYSIIRLMVKPPIDNDLLEKRCKKILRLIHFPYIKL